ncbi:hypothetical protein NC653_004895 [Populus alba x Populus x berolinensis]|uniref:Uncharacterized protein n=1 Tax=Populus alba x Populus x berolinensis TaxID=444605 RepID=A0AAD6RAZ8_9ROSI|nr:hypothetical protein NC653_004895 [Populus alba x Populus x berolinensis]
MPILTFLSLLLKEISYSHASSFARIMEGGYARRLFANDWTALILPLLLAYHILRPGCGLSFRNVSRHSSQLFKLNVVAGRCG